MHDQQLIIQLASDGWYVYIHQISYTSQSFFHIMSSFRSWNNNFCWWKDSSYSQLFPQWMDRMDRQHWIQLSESNAVCWCWHVQDMGYFSKIFQGSRLPLKDSAGFWNEMWRNKFCVVNWLHTSSHCTGPKNIDLPSCLFYMLLPQLSHRVKEQWISPPGHEVLALKRLINVRYFQYDQQTMPDRSIPSGLWATDMNRTIRKDCPGFIILFHTPFLFSLVHLLYDQTAVNYT